MYMWMNRMKTLFIRTVKVVFNKKYILVILKSGNYLYKEFYSNCNCGSQYSEVHA